MEVNDLWFDDYLGFFVDRCSFGVLIIGWGDWVCVG